MRTDASERFTPMAYQKCAHHSTFRRIIIGVERISSTEAKIIVYSMNYSRFKIL